MKLKGIEDMDLINYKLPALYVIFPHCTFKCGKICHNYSLQTTENYDISINYIMELYNKNPLTKAIVLSGLEPFDSFDDMMDLIKAFRDKYNDDIVIYTGYYPYEVLPYLKQLTHYDNIIIKFGRYIEGSKEYYNNLLGVKLQSNNQYAVRLIKDNEKVIDALIDKEGYCPCVLGKNEDTKCCCKYFRELDEDSECHCGLFSK